MDYEIIREYLPLYKDALFLTLRIGWQGILLSLILGIVGAGIEHFKVPVLRAIITVYVELFRNTPLLVQLFFIYFALPKPHVYKEDFLDVKEYGLLCMIF